VEGRRSDSAADQSTAEIFRNWGIPTAQALIGIAAALPDTPLIASGGIQHGLHGAKALRLGASVVGQAAAVLDAATQGPEAVMAKVEAFAKALRISCFCTNSVDLETMRGAPLLAGAFTPATA
jgi:isopentenyl-diphosphate Delta-isomerase